MTTPIDDGGPAFPVQESVISGGSDGVPAARGMSLREYFAGQALIGLMARDVAYIEGQTAAAACVRVADALVAELRKGGVK